MMLLFVILFLGFLAMASVCFADWEPSGGFGWLMAAVMLVAYVFK